MNKPATYLMGENKTNENLVKTEKTTLTENYQHTKTQT